MTFQPQKCLLLASLCVKPAAASNPLKQFKLDFDDSSLATPAPPYDPLNLDFDIDSVELVIMVRGVCTFKHVWFTESTFKDWIEKIPINERSARCKLCKKTLDISSMGKTALTSHSEGAKHKFLIGELEKKRANPVKTKTMDSFVVTTGVNVTNEQTLSTSESQTHEMSTPQTSTSHSSKKKRCEY